jgi:hypothetical protein
MGGGGWYCFSVNGRLQIRTLGDESRAHRVRGTLPKCNCPTSCSSFMWSLEATNNGLVGEKRAGAELMWGKKDAKSHTRIDSPTQPVVVRIR